MSLKYRNASGNETPVAGLNGTSGEFVPSVSVIRTGQINLPATAAGAWNTFDVTFDTPMPDADYQVIMDNSAVAYVHVQAVRYKSAAGFSGILYTRDEITGSNSVIKYTAFKLMTDEVREADSAHIAQNTANFAPAFSETTSYAVGDYVTYNNMLYRCTTAHTAGVWVAGHFTQVTVGGDLGAIVPSKASASNKLVTESDLTKPFALSVNVDNLYVGQGVSKAITTSLTQQIYMGTLGNAIKIRTFQSTTNFFSEEVVYYSGSGIRRTTVSGTVPYTATVAGSLLTLTIPDTMRLSIERIG